VSYVCGAGLLLIFEPGNQENCFRAQNNDKVDVRAVGRIAMELMQKYAKDDGAVGVEDLSRWPSDSDAVGFLSETTSASCVTQLIKVKLLIPGFTSLIFHSILLSCLSGSQKN
jgi:hypothetical protein